MRHFACVVFATTLLAGDTSLGLLYGTFDTQEVRPWDVVAQDASKLETFPGMFTAPPLFAAGLTELNVSNVANIRVSATATNITQTSAYLHLSSWADTRLYSASGSWLVVSARDPSYQAGQFTTTDDHPWYLPQLNTSRKIVFARPYAAPPKIVVWLSMIDMDRTRNWRVSAFATDVTAAGFTININTWADSLLYEATASWVAYPSSMPGVWSGVYSTYDVRFWNPPQLLTNGTVTFPQGLFQCDPTVLLALNYLDVDYHADLRIRASANPVSHSGMTWHFDGWADTILYAAGASYIAFAPTTTTTSS